MVFSALHFMRYKLIVRPAGGCTDEECSWPKWLGVQVFDAVSSCRKVMEAVAAKWGF